MRDMKELCRIIEEELGKIAEKGLNTSNLETAYKLIDMYKDIKNTEYWDTKCEYYETVLDEMRGGGSSYAMEHDYSGRHRDSRGRYSRDGRMRDGRYSRADSKEHMIEKLEDMMEEADGRVKSAIRKCISELERD